jgi:hypothetical protein
MQTQGSTAKRGAVSGTSSAPKALGGGAAGAASSINALSGPAAAALPSTVRFRVRGAPAGGVTPKSIARRGSGGGGPGSVGGGGGLGTGDGSDDGWLDVSAGEDDEERRLLRELAQQRKAVKKRQDLQAWAREKELRQKAAFRLEEEERRHIDDAVAAREQKRAERARKQKQRIEEYQNNVRAEAQKIHELVKLGIDPSSLLP